MTMGRKMLNNFIKIIKLNDENKLLNGISTYASQLNSDWTGDKK